MHLGTSRPIMTLCIGRIEQTAQRKQQQQQQQRHFGKLLVHTFCVGMVCAQPCGLPHHVGLLLGLCLARPITDMLRGGQANVPELAAP